MPTYEYACKECGEHLEVVQSFKDDALTECPSCNGSLRKVFSAAGIIFKGSGWHVKDYASSSNRGPSRDGGSSGDGDTKTKDSAAKETSTSGSKDGGTAGTSDSGSSGKAASGTTAAGKAAASDSGSSSASSSASEKKSA